MLFDEGLRRLVSLPDDVLFNLKASYGFMNLSEIAEFTEHETARRFNYPLGVFYKVPEYSSKVSDLLDPTAGLAALKYAEELPYLKNHVLIFAALSQLDAKTSLSLHCDLRWCHVYGKRLQVPIYADDSYFISRNRSFRLTEGEICELDNISPHLATNRAATHKLAILADFLPRDLFNYERATGRCINRVALSYDGTFQV